MNLLKRMRVLVVCLVIVLGLSFIGVKKVYAESCVCVPQSFGKSKVVDAETKCNSGKIPKCFDEHVGPNVIAHCQCIQDPNNTTTNGSNNTSSSDPFAGCSDNSVNTALGCIPVKMEQFVPWLLKGLFGIAGGIAFLLMVYGFILIATSGGDEKKVAGAKETITSALIGLLVCIFSIFILRLITVNILQIPGIN